MTWPALGVGCRPIDSIDTETVGGAGEILFLAPPTASADSQPLMNQPRCGRMWVGDGQTSDRRSLGPRPLGNWMILRIVCDMCGILISENLTHAMSRC